MEGVGLPEKAKIDQKSPKKSTVEDKNGQNMKMEASDGRPRELRSSIDWRRARWENLMVGESLTCPHAPLMRRRVRGSCRRKTHVTERESLAIEVLASSG